MTRFSKTDIPPEVDDLEDLIIWAMEILTSQYPNQVCVESRDANDVPREIRRVAGNKFYYTAPDVPTWRYVGTFNFDLAAEVQQYGRVWQHAKPLGDLAIPPTMKAAA